MRNNRQIVKEINAASRPASGAKQVKPDNPVDSRRKNNLPKAQAVKNAVAVEGAHKRCAERQISGDSRTLPNSGCSNV